MKALLAACFAFVAAGAALAQQQPADRPRAPSAGAGATAPNPSAAVVDPRAADRLFARFDTNRDGFLSDAELDAARADRGNWIALDRNRDGRIARAEFTALGSD